MITNPVNKLAPTVYVYFGVFLTDWLNALLNRLKKQNIASKVYFKINSVIQATNVGKFYFKSLKGKTAIVTGCSKGIGLATTMSLLKKGVIVAGWSRTPINISHKNFIHFVTDVSNFESVQKSHNQTIAKLGQSDILINNAGIGFISGFEELDKDKWHKMFDVNVHGMYYCSKMVIPGMKAKGAGHIINIGSIAGTTAVKNMVGYASTKHAVTGMSHSLFMELRDFGIKVTCMYPGSVKTGFFDNIDEIEAHDHMMSPEDIASTIIHVLESPPNYLHVDIEVRPLKPKG